MTLKPVGARRDNPVHDRSPVVSPRPHQLKLSPAKVPGPRPHPHRRAFPLDLPFLGRRAAFMRPCLQLTPVSIIHRSRALAAAMAQAAVAPGPSARHIKPNGKFYLTFLLIHQL